jgi:RNA polymerase sigma factor (sigma-70 family)
LSGNQKNANLLADHLFRHEAGKMVSALTRIFGLSHIEIAEDIVQDTFVKALQDWSFNNIPPNPQAWLYKAAKNKTIDYLRHQKHVQNYESESGNLLKSEWTMQAEVNNVFLDKEINDNQLRMIFASCHPALPMESRIAFTLKTLCGFNAREIAKALLTTEVNINKRLTRAKQKLRDKHLKFEIPAGKELESRLDSVYKVLYLLFNEGYSAAEADSFIRKDVCAEALRLAEILSENSIGKKPKTFALMSLMCFQAARLDARMDDLGYIILLKEQDRSKWNAALISRGLDYLSRSAYGDELSEYHIEAAIASYHSTADSFDNTNWHEILNLYDILIKIKPNPITILNRSIVIAELNGVYEAINEINNLKELEQYYLLHATLGEFYSRLNQPAEAKQHYEKALKLVASPAEKKLIQQKILKI